MYTSGAVNMLCFVWKFSCIKFHSLIQELFVYLQNMSTVSFLTSYIQYRTQRVFLNGQYSTEGIAECGIP